MASYRSAWAHVAPVFAKTPICELDGPTITTWIDSLQSRRPHQKTVKPLASGQKRKVGIVINALCELAVKQKIVYENPMGTGYLVHQEEGKRRALRVSEVDRLLEAAPTPEAKFFVRVLLMTALRPGEAKGLHVEDLDYRRQRDLPVGGELLLDLEDECVGKAPTDPLLTDEYGHVWATARWRRIWAKMCDDADIDQIDTYTLKYTAVSMAIASGADVYAIQRMCGHADASTPLNVYRHLWAERLKERTAGRDGLRAVPEAG